MHIKDYRNQQNSHNKLNIRFIIHIVCIVGVFSCVAWLVWYLISLHNNEKLMKDLEDNYVMMLDSSSTASEDMSVPTPEPNLFGDRVYPDFTGLEVPKLEPDFDGLQEVNPDIYAWLYVPDTAINYPVVQRDGDADYYLQRDLQGNSSAAGTLFTQYYNHKDWMDNLTVIYGHNMRDGSMFASLHYFEDSQFFQEHPYIYIYTPEYTLVYQVFAAYEFSDVHLLLNYTMNDYDSFALYLDQVLTQDGLNVNINQDLEVTADDRVLTLSTCVGGNRGEHRYLVQAKLSAVEKTE